MILANIDNQASSVIKVINNGFNTRLVYIDASGNLKIKNVSSVATYLTNATVTSEGSGSGPSSTLYVSANQAYPSILCSISTPTGEISSWDLDISDNSGSSWSRVASTIIDPTYNVTNLAPTTTYLFRHFSRIVTETSGGTVSATTSEAPLIQPWYRVAPSMAYAYDGVNDGSIPFNPSGEARTFSYRLKNNTNRTVDKIRLEYPNLRATSASVTAAIGIGGLQFNADTYSSPVSAVMAPGIVAGDGQKPSMTTIEITIPTPIVPGGDIVVRHKLNAGDPWSALGDVGNSTIPTEVVWGPRMSDSDIPLTGTWSGVEGYGVGLAAYSWHVSGDPMVRWFIIGDSRTCGIPPTGNSRGEWIRHLNITEAANGQRHQGSSWGQGAMNFDWYDARLEHLADTQGEYLQQTFDGGFVDIASWNQTTSTITAAQAIIAKFEARKAQFANLGLWLLPCIVTVPSIGHQTAGEIEAWEYLRTYTTTNGGVDFSPTTVDPNDAYMIDATKSEDLVHINVAAQEAMGIACAPLVSNALIALGKISA